MKSPRLVVYDLDGTLVDTLQDITNAANYLLSQMQAASLTPNQVRRFVGRGIHQLVGECLKTDDAGLVAEGMRIYRAYYQQHLADNSKLYPGARQALDYFKTRVQAVISNKPNPYSTDLLKALGVEGYFMDIIGGDSPYPRKPDPASLNAVMERAGVSPHEAVMIGDSPIDVEMGRQAGVAVVTVTHGLADRDELVAAQPEAIVDSFQALIALAKTQGW